MSAEAVLDLVIGNIADGAPVNWRQLEEESRSEEDRDWAGALRILSEVANLHRLMEDPLPAQFEASVTLPADVPRVLPDGTPNTWGRYRLNHKVGEGSFGRVYRAWDSQLERDVALKILHGHVSDTRLKERLLREGRALAKVRHPNVVTVLGVEAHEDRVGLCMEFVHGETLSSHVQAKGALSALEAAVIGEDVCRALAAVHRAGFVHRDVKARNVMRDETGRIVLMDFGTGAEVNRAWALGGLVGTPAYMAPEVLEGDPASERSDVYSVGVLLYFLVSKAYPVVGQTIEDVRDAHAQRRRTPLIERRPDLPVSFLRVVERATAADPEERYASAPELLHGLQEVVRALKPVSFFTLPVRIAASIAAAALALVAFGALTSAVFNLVFERGGFAEESLTDWLVWGRRAFFAPVFTFGFGGLVGVATLMVVRRALLASSAAAKGMDRAVREAWARRAHRLRLDEAPIVASVGLTVAASALVAAWWRFLPLLTSLMSFATRDSANSLTLLAPDYVAYHNQYRVVFSSVVALSLVIWYPVVRLIRKGQTLHWGLWVGGAVVTCVALFFLHFPYRLLYFNEQEAVTWNGTYCYVIGQRMEDMLLFCPESAPPRSRIVRNDASSVQRLGITENVFTRFGTRFLDDGAATNPAVRPRQD